MMKSFNKIIKPYLLSLVNFSKGYKLMRPFYSGIGHVLLFHRICKKNNTQRLSRCSGLEVTPEYLDKTIRFFLEHHYDIVSLGKLSDIFAKRNINKKFVIFTIDDGYLDNLTVAYPIFKKYNIPFTIYITTGFPDKSAVPWWYLLEDLILKTNSVVFKIAGKIFEFRCASLDEKERAFLEISTIIKSSQGDNYWGKIQQIFIMNQVEMYKRIEEMMLNWQQIRELSSDPLVTFGAHSVNHYCLANLSESEARYEIFESKKKLESHINREVKHFAYPFGGKGEAGAREFKIVKELGFQTAVTGRSANIFKGHRSYCEALPRITMGENLDFQKLVFLVNGLMHCRNNNFKQVVTE